MGFSNDTIIVTFDSYTDTRVLSRPGFAQAFFEGRKIDFIHFIARDNDWYQYPELLEATEAAAKLTSKYSRVVAYGSSMGGYAAIRFGAMVGARIAIALSPQYSIDPKVVPFENRWAADSSRIAFLFDKKQPCAFTETSIVFFDPFDPDSRHVELYEGQTKLHRIRVPNSGHPCGGFLSEVGLLQEVLVQVAKGDINFDRLQLEIRRRRKDSGQLFFNLSKRAKRLDQQLNFAEKAIELRPRTPEYFSQYGNVLAHAGRFKDAETAHKKALSFAPNHPVFLYHLSECHERAGDLEKSFEVMSQLLQKHPANVNCYPRFNYLVERLRERDRAAAASELPFHEHNLDTPPRGDPLRFLMKSRLTRPAARLLRALRFRHRGQVVSGSLGIKTPAEDCSQRAEILVTTMPAPPPFISSWRRHRHIMGMLPAEKFDLLLVGDSLVEFWLDEFWKSLHVFNMGVAADKTQHVSWRLDQIATGSLKAEASLIVVGTNNLGAADTAEGISAGIEAIAKRLKRVAPDAKQFVLEIPPCGPNFRFRNNCRTETNMRLRAIDLFTTIDAEYEITGGFSQPCPNYHEDQIHFSKNGYARLTAISRSKIGLK